MIAVDHPLVAEYLQRFDVLSRRLPESRRLALRDEIAAHLNEAVPVGTSNSEAARAIAEFGRPEEILASESMKPNSASRRRRVILISSAVAVLAVGISIAIPLTGRLAAPPSVVNAHPNGPERVTEGRAYAEYIDEIKSIDDPLPEGAVWPEGVPDNMYPDENPDEPQEHGVGRNIAQFTWLCAWESEYVSAFDAGDETRQVAAEAMVRKWATSEFYLSMGDAESGWVKTVITPMSFGDATGVKNDRVRMCEQAYIYYLNR